MTSSDSLDAPERARHSRCARRAVKQLFVHQLIRKPLRTFRADAEDTDAERPYRKLKEPVARRPCAAISDPHVPHLRGCGLGCPTCTRLSDLSRGPVVLPDGRATRRLASSTRAGRRRTRVSARCRLQRPPETWIPFLHAAGAASRPRFPGTETGERPGWAGTGGLGLFQGNVSPI